MRLFTGGIFPMYVVLFEENDEPIIKNDMCELLFENENHVPNGDNDSEVCKESSYPVKLRVCHGRREESKYTATPAISNRCATFEICILKSYMPSLL